LTGLDYSVLQIKTKIASFHTADSKPVKQEVNGTLILPPLVFPDLMHSLAIQPNLELKTRPKQLLGYLQRFEKNN
jgi:hypothetical protein